MPQIEKNAAERTAIERFQRAIGLHQNGDLRQAQRLYEEILRQDPRHFDALNMAGVIAGQTGHYRKAIDFITRAIEVFPGNDSAFRNRAFAFEKLGQWEEALQNYDQAIVLNPGIAQTFYQRGNVLVALKRFDAAFASFSHAVSLKPDFGDAYFGQASVLQVKGALEAALATYERAAKAKPRFFEALLNRGVVLQSLGRHPEALASYREAAGIKSDSAEAHYNCGKALLELGRPEEALVSYDTAIALKPDYFEAHFNRGVVCGNRLDWDAALSSYDRALAISPKSAVAHFNKATVLLATGDLARGWPAFEWRWKYTNATPLLIDGRPPRQPLWLGREPIVGKTVLLYDEQGLGDTLQFCRYVPAVAALGAKVILRVQAPLLTLLAGLEGVSSLISSDDALPGFDRHCPLMSLPLAFKTTLQTIPARMPYLRGDPNKALAWKSLLGDRHNPRVGVVWSGGFRPNQPEIWEVSGRRNIPLASFASLRHPDIEFHSLQKGQPAESELAALIAAGWSGPPLIDFTDRLTDFSETAALIENLDLVISVDTSTAHLAAALGKPVWLLNRFDTCWRWLLDRDDSPWYPTVRIFRQPRPGDWGSVLERVRAELDEWLKGYAIL